MEKQIEHAKSWMRGIDDLTTSDEVAFITTKDISAITSGASRPAKAFTSPFLGETVQQVNDWFVANIRPIGNGYTGFSFLLMDSQTVEDNTCLVVCNLLDEVETVRCHFEVAQAQVESIEFGCEGMRDGYRDLFMDTGEVMTEALYDLSVKEQLYVQDGKLKVKTSIF